MTPSVATNEDVWQENTEGMKKSRRTVEELKRNQDSRMADKSQCAVEVLVSFPAHPDRGIITLLVIIKQYQTLVTH